MTETIQSPWRIAPAVVTLPPGELHLWRALVIDLAGAVGHTLSPAECERADRFHFQKDRERFVAGRGLVRTVLARYLGVDGATLQFTVGPHGKPALAFPNASLCFNLSHSGDLLLIALMEAREVGVDLEFIRGDVPFLAVAQHCFSAEDVTRIALLPEPQKACRFYQLWTSNEARLKASGVGLGRGTTAVEPDRWSLLTLTPAAGYAAAVAVEGERDFQLTCWSWLK